MLCMVELFGLYLFSGHVKNLFSVLASRKKALHFSKS